MSVTQARNPPKDPINPSGVQGKHAFEVRVNDEFFPGTASSFRNLRVHSNIHTILPTVSFESDDLYSLLTNQVDGFSDEGEGTIGNGVKISVGVSDGTFAPKLWNFRVFSVPSISPGGRYQKISIVGVYDAMKWWRGICKGAYKGTSLDVLRKMATECGLGFFGPHTFSDAMTWIPSAESYSSFASKIEKFAWSDDSSCPNMALDVDGVLSFVDLNRLANSQPIATAKYLKPVESETDFRVITLRIKTPSGVGNLSGGYSGIAVEELLNGEVAEHSDIQAVRHGGYLDFSQSISSDLESAFWHVNSLNAGNTHKNYNRAGYQNRRQSSLYSIHAEVYTDKSTGLNLFDVVMLDMADQKDGGDQLNYSGVYFVSAKVVGINGTEYFEKIRLTTNSRGLNPARDMK